MLRLRLLSRIVLLIVVSLVIVWIAAIAMFYRSHGEDMRRPHPTPLQIAALVKLLEAGDPATKSLLLAAATNRYTQVKLIPAGATEAAAGTPVNNAIRAPYAAALDGRPMTLVTRSDRHLRFALPHRLMRWANLFEFRIGMRNGETLVVDTRHAIAINRLGLPVGFGAGFFGTVVALIALLVAQRETKPLERLAAAVDEVDLSRHPVALPDARHSAPEIRALIAAFNRLQGRLSGMLRARMALIGGISHDVRTFAARLRLRIDAIPDEAERQRAAIDIDDMIRLLDDALLSSRAGAGELAQELVELAPLVEAEAEDRRAQGETVTFLCSYAAARVCILGDRLALRRIIGNIVDNALKYGHAAYLEMELSGNRILLIVDDEGPGIPGDQCDLMLEPFSRLENSRSRQTGGAGLGLAVARSLIEAHGGKIDITAAPGGGARIVLALPVFTSEALAETGSKRSAAM